MDEEECVSPACLDDSLEADHKAQDAPGLGQHQKDHPKSKQSCQNKLETKLIKHYSFSQHISLLFFLNKKVENSRS